MGGYLGFLQSETEPIQIFFLQFAWFMDDPKGFRFTL